MEIDRTESLATAGAPQNGSPRIWVESVSAGMRTVEAMIRELSQNDVPMLVVAEHGSGKAAVAARIHSLSRRAAEAFHVDQRSLFAAASFTPAERGYSGSAGLVSLGGGPRLFTGRTGAQSRDPKFLSGIQLAGKHSRAERRRSSHCRARR